jgi:hypothetical protein
LEKKILFDDIFQDCVTETVGSNRRVSNAINRVQRNATID